MKNSSLKFQKAYEQKASINVLLESLDCTINTIVNSCFNKFCGAIDADDIAQEVRLHLWENVFQKEYLKGMDSDEAYKYLTTTIKTWAGRVIGRSINENAPCVDEKRTISLFITLSLFNIEYNNFPLDTNIETYIDRLRNNCSDLLNGEAVLNYLAPKEDRKERDPEPLEFAGFSSRTFYKAVELLKKRAKEIL